MKTEKASSTNEDALSHLFEIDAPNVNVSRESSDVALLSSGGDRWFWSARSCLAIFGLRPGLADVDTALEEGAVFNRDARRHDIAGQRPVTANVHTIASSEIAAYFSEHHDFARIDIG